MSVGRTGPGERAGLAPSDLLPLQQFGVLDPRREEGTLAAAFHHVDHERAVDVKVACTRLHVDSGLGVEFGPVAIEAKLDGLNRRVDVHPL